MKLLPVLLSLAWTSVAPAPALQFTQLSPYDDRLKVTVVGEGVVHAIPDRVVLGLGIETWDAKITAAKEKCSAIRTAAVAEMTAAGVAEKDIRTDALAIRPRSTDESQPGEPSGFLVRNTIVATLADASKLEEVVTAVLRTGVTHVHGIEFESSELKAHQEQARELALKAAHEKAVQMSAVLGQVVQRPIEITEHPGGSWHLSSWSGEGWGGGMARAGLESAGAGHGFPLGKMAIRASVTVTFELKK